MKIKYLIKRICGIDIRGLFSSINKVKKKNKKNRFLILLDIINCGFKYQAGYNDYYLFEMYKMNNKERETIVTRGINNRLIKFFNNNKFNVYFKDKTQFNLKFNEYLNREWLLLDDYESFDKFINNKEDIIVKPIDGMCGKKIEKIIIKNYDKRELFNYLKKNQLLLLEEVIIQNEIINKLHPHSINTLRIVTISFNNKTSILTTFFRIGNGKVVDNFNSGGMVVPVNRKTGIIEYPALNKKGHLFEFHPLTKTSIIGFEIPLFKEACQLVMEASLKVPEIKMVGWDVAITPNGPVLVEGNEFPGHDIYQLPPHRKNNIGLLPDFEESLKEVGVTKKMLGI